jgi:tryptophanyl-tRNA synthetase
MTTATQGGTEPGSAATGRERVLTGVKPTGNLHLGNYFGAIKPAIELSHAPGNEVIFMCVDWHGLTNRAHMKESGTYTYSLLATYLALGFRLEGNAIILQSDFPQILEVAWMLACVTNLGLLERAHAYKDAIQSGKDPTCGLFYYPVLMASDILTFDAAIVPVGRDQLQHLEYAADMAGYFNALAGTEVFRKPKPVVQQVPLLVGTDGQRKMGKSYNDIPLFGPAKDIEKRIKGITTDARGLDDPKDPDTCAVFQILSSFAREERIHDMRERLLRGTGYGYGHAKNDLIDAHRETFGAHQEAYEHYLRSPDEMRRLLEPGRLRATELAKTVCSRARDALGLKTLKTLKPS